MVNMTGIDFAWWVTAIELPVLAGLFWMIQRLRKDAETDLDRQRRSTDTVTVQLREALAAYKLEVAKTYASITTLKDLENRLTDHLLRIEHKIDGVLTDGGVR